MSKTLVPFGNYCWRANDSYADKQHLIGQQELCRLANHEFQINNPRRRHVASSTNAHDVAMQRVPWYLCAGSRQYAVSLTAIANPAGPNTWAVKVENKHPATLVDGHHRWCTRRIHCEPQVFGGVNSFPSWQRCPVSGGKGRFGVKPSHYITSHRTAMLPPSSFPRFKTGEPLQGRMAQRQF